MKEHALFSSKTKAIAAAPKMMDKYCNWSPNWRNGMGGFGREDEDNYLNFEYSGDSVGDEGL